MPSSYPGGYDELNSGVGSGGQPLSSPDHPSHHTALADAVEAVQVELGLDPAGAAATVRARLDALDTTVAGKVAASVVDAKGDLIAATAADTVARVAVGPDGQVLTADSASAAGVKWSAAPGGGIPATIVDAKGDVIAATAADTVARVAVGTDGQVLTADSASSAGVKWSTPAAGDPAVGGDLSGTASNAQIVAGAVGATELATDAVTSAKIAADAVGSSEIAAGAVGASEIADGSITDTEVAAANKDGAAGTASMRTLGTGAAQAAAGNHNHSGVYEPADSDLTAIAGLSTTGLVERTGAGTAAIRTIGVAAGADIPSRSDADSRYVTQGLVDAKGDLIAATAADTVARVAVGTDGQVLTADSASSAGVKWAAGGGGGIPATIVDAKGDVIAATAADTVARVAVGSDRQVLIADSASTAGVKWAMPASQVLAINDNYYFPANSAGVNYGDTAVAGYIRYQPIHFDTDVTATRIGLYLQTVGVAGGDSVTTGRLGIYESNAAGTQPGSLLVDAGTLDLTVTTGWREITISQALSRSTLYWMAFLPGITGTGPKLYYWWGGTLFDSFVGGTGQPGNALTLNGPRRYQWQGWRQTVSYGPLPGSAGTLTQGVQGDIFPCLALKVSV